MGMRCKNSTVVVAMAVSLMLMHNCVEEAAAAASIEGEMELISFFSPSKSMAMGLGEQRDEEFLEEITRRMLASSGPFIGNDALGADKNPCSHKGLSYYNSKCNKGANQGGPYKRSCLAITRCQRG